MDIEFDTQKLERLCNDDTKLKRELGFEQAKRVRRRLDDLHAAETLAVMMTLPQARCHELKGDRKGQFSVDIKHPYRLIFVPANKPVPKLPDGGIDISKVTAVRIVGMEDTHG